MWGGAPGQASVLRRASAGEWEHEASTIGAATVAGHTPSGSVLLLLLCFVCNMLE